MLDLFKITDEEIESGFILPTPNYSEKMSEFEMVSELINAKEINPILKRTILKSYNMPIKDYDRRSEGIFFNTLIEIVNAGTKERDFKLQYPIYGYLLDCFIDDTTEFGINCYVIEFDEQHHKKQKIKDQKRMNEIVKELLKMGYETINVIRINEENSKTALKHLIPFFAYFDSHCLDIAIQNKILTLEYFEL